MSTTIFFERFYRLCKTHRTSPNAVGAQLGLSSGSITAWKHGAMPRPDTIQKLADHFGVPVDYLLGNTAHSSDAWHLHEVLQQRPELQQLLELSLKASEEEVESTLRILEALSRE